MTPITVTYDGSLIDSEIPDMRFLWAIWAPFLMVWTQGAQQGEVHIPKYFVTDFASIPRLLYSLVPPWDGDLRKAAVVHDVIYMTNEYPRAFADALLFAGMSALKAPAWKKWLVWCGVRLGGRRAYQTGFARQVANAERFQLRFAPVPLGSIVICDPILGALVYDPIKNMPAEYVTRKGDER